MPDFLRYTLSLAASAFFVCLFFLTVCLSLFVCRCLAVHRCQGRQACVFTPAGWNAYRPCFIACAWDVAGLSALLDQFTLGIPRSCTRHSTRQKEEVTLLKKRLLQCTPKAKWFC